jgi:tetratricopeptide (TPR) repeat protein
MVDNINLRKTVGVSLAAAIVILTAACEPRPGPLHEVREGVPPPKGTVQVTEAVDGLIVGHRLMAAGEYEVALKAYTRAASQHGMNIDVLSALGSANLRLGRLRQAEELLKLATKKDEKFVPAWNNLGVVYASQGRDGEAERVFRLAFALDSGKSAEIRSNYSKAIAKLENTGYSVTQEEAEEYELVRRGNGRYMLLSTPDSL